MGFKRARLYVPAKIVQQMIDRAKKEHLIYWISLLLNVRSDVNDGRSQNLRGTWKNSVDFVPVLGHA